MAAGDDSEESEEFDEFEESDEFGAEFEAFDPDRLVGCAYWRCDEIFEQRTSNHQFCRKACRSRQRKWERAQERKRVRDARKAERN